MNTPPLHLVLACFVLALGMAPPGAGTPITITAHFSSHAPHSSLIFPVAGALCELIDADPISNDVLARSMTDGAGAVTFTYDSGIDDGWLGGRVDPFVRCYASLMVESGDQAVEKFSVVQPYRLSGSNPLTRPAAYSIDSPTWDNNNESRSAEVTVGADKIESFVFLMMRAVAQANARSTGPDGTTLEPAPVALQGNVCAGRTRVVFPATLTTGFQSLSNEILVQWPYREDFDTIAHEYGHHEMWEAYGGLVYGDYARTVSDHYFNAEVSQGILPAGLEWTAFAEAWADFSAVVTKGYPRYRMFDVEADDPVQSPQCEGTICRILWDVWDTAADRVVDGDGRPIDRPLQGGVALDDDPFGFAPREPYSGLPGRNQLKSIIRNDKPKSLADLRAAFNRRYAHDAFARRALEAVLWRHGIRNGIYDRAPQCTLSVEGDKQGDKYTGTVRLSATVTDPDVAADAPEDARLMHVTYYWTEYSEWAKALSRPKPSEWHVIGVDIEGKDGWKCEWPATAPGRSEIKMPVVFIAVASDFFQNSSFGTTKATFTSAQAGPFHLEAGSTGGAAGGGTLPPEEPGILSEEGTFYSAIGVADIEPVGRTLLVSNRRFGLRGFDAGSQPAVLRSTYKPAGSVFTDSAKDADVFVGRDETGQRRQYAALAFGSEGLRILDITDPARPQEVGALTAVPDRVASGPVRFHAGQVVAQPPYAYVAGGSLSVVDIREPRAPREVSYWAPAYQGSCSTIRDFAVAGALAYLACRETGLSILDLNQVRAQRTFAPHLARREPSLKVPEKMILGNYRPDGHVVALALMDPQTDGRRFAVVVDNRGSGKGGAPHLHVIDVTRPSEPAEAGRVDVPASPFCIRMIGNLALVGHSRGITVFDVSTPSDPKVAGEYRKPTLSGVQVMAVDGDRVFVSPDEAIHILRLRR